MRTASILDMGGPTMGTSWSLRAARTVPELSDGAVAAAVEQVLATVIAQMSNWEAGSDISRFNRAPLDTWCAMPAPFLTVLHAGLAIARSSDGAFDPAIGTLVDAWGFGPAGQGNAPADRTVTPSIGWRAIAIADDRVRRTAPVTLDFSGIAKGYAVDAVAERLMELGLHHFLVEIGGELRGSGVRPDGQPWWVDIEAPPGLSLPVTRVALCGLSIATSGDYRRWHDKGGRRYAHSIDPRTGVPVDNGVASVSVLHASAMQADAWATALLVLGVEEGLALAAREGVAALMIWREAGGAAEYMSPALAAMLG